MKTTKVKICKNCSSENVGKYICKDCKWDCRDAISPSEGPGFGEIEVTLDN